VDRKREIMAIDRLHRGVRTVATLVFVDESESNRRMALALYSLNATRRHRCKFTASETIAARED